MATKSGDETPDAALIRELQRLADGEDDAGYLDVLNRALSSVRTEDNGEPLVKLNRETLPPRIFLRLVDLHVATDERTRLLLRETVVHKLNRAANSLPPGYSLIVRDAFRTEKVVWDLYDLYMDQLNEREPNLSRAERELRIRNYLAMPDDPVPPGHMTGGAVDLNLGDADGQRVHLEVSAALIPRKLQAPTFCPGLPREMIERRRILFDSLVNQGFQNYSREYWHYSYGDAYWAVRRRDKTAIYGIPRTAEA